MYSRIALAAAVLLFFGCGKKPTPMPQPSTKPASEKPMLIEGHFGDDDAEPRHLSFKITQTFEKQKPSDAAPFHTAGGEWTFFECQALDDPKVEFTVGVLSKRGDGKVPIAWGEAMLIVKDRAAGDRFIKRFARAFEGKEPKSLKQTFVPKPLSMKTAVLGENLQREAKAGFSGTGGGWTATKWFVEDDGESGEVFFNYNLKSKQGEFSEKDADYAEDLLAVFASTLRDGPKPERTPETDPNLTRNGPAIGPPRKLPPKGCWQYQFSPDGKFAVYLDDKKIMAAAVDRPDAKPIEIAQIEHALWQMHVVNQNLDLVEQEVIPENPPTKRSDDPMRIWWVDGKKKSKTLLRAPEKGLNLVETPVSPGERYVAFSLWVDDKNKNTRTKALLIVDREKDKTIVCDKDAELLSVARWTRTQSGLRLEAISNRWGFDKKQPPALYHIDPATGKMEFQRKIDVAREVDNPPSPDGKRRARVEKDRLIVTELETGKQRTFIFHEDDRRFVDSESIEWVNPIYLKFNSPKLALINVATMKMSYFRPATAMKIIPNTCQFSPDFRWVLFKSGTNEDDALYLAPIEMAKGR